MDEASTLSGLPSHVPFHTMKGYTLSVAKQVLTVRMDAVIQDDGTTCKADFDEHQPRCLARDLWRVRA
jgi:hypothetical protein